MLRGKQVHYIPGWDCHGLPIELKALGELGTSGLTPLQIRQKGLYLVFSCLDSEREMLLLFSFWAGGSANVNIFQSKPILFLQSLHPYSEDFF